jgi:hypothetical protein
MARGLHFAEEPGEEIAMAKQPRKKRKPDSLKEAPSDPEGVQRPSEGGAGEEFSRRRRGGYNPPTSTKI